MNCEKHFNVKAPGICPICLIAERDRYYRALENILKWADSKVNSRDKIETIYQIAAKNNGFGDREILLKFDTLIKTKTPRFESYWTTRSDTDERRIITKVRQVWDGISKGVFVPNDQSWRCKNCSYKKACDEFMEGGNDEKSD